LTDYFRRNQFLSIYWEEAIMDFSAIGRGIRQMEIGRKLRLFSNGKAMFFMLPLLVAAAPGTEGASGGCQSRPQVREESVAAAPQARTADAASDRRARRQVEPERGEASPTVSPARPAAPQPAPAAEPGPKKDFPKLAVWDLASRNTPESHAQELTSILVSEIGKINKYEVYSQENVRTLAGWTEERMKLGCTSTQCLTALGQMDVARLISGSVAKIGNRYSVSLNLFDTQNSKSEKAVSEFCNSEDELIELIQVASRKLLGAELPPARAEGRPTDEKPNPPAAKKSSRPILKK
jgi:hypothetical protein